MSGFRVVLDACVLVPIVKADLLLTLAQRQVYHPLWSNAILGETKRAILKIRPTMTDDRAQARIDKMNAAFEDALVEGWEPLENCIIGLPDLDDRHVVAAAVRGSAAAIVTDNIKHFPDAALEPWGLHAISSDEFLLDLLDLSSDAVLSSLIEMTDKRRNPPVTTTRLLEILELSCAPGFAEELRLILDTE
jgi:predicted nucleic acid-binding protein